MKNGTFKAIFELPALNFYEHLYLVDSQFINDIEAYAYKWIEFASAENSVVEV